MRTVQKEKILDQCERLFLQLGVQATGVAEIAKAVGISKGTLYYHYKNKDAIVDDVAERYFDKTRQALLQFMSILVSGVSIENIVNTCLNVLTMKKTTEKMHYTLLAYGVVSYPPLKEKFKERYEEWSNMIYNALEGYQSNDYNLLLSNILLATIDGLAIKNMLGMKGLSDDKNKILELIKGFDIQE